MNYVKLDEVAGRMKAPRRNIFLSGKGRSLKVEWARILAQAAPKENAARPLASAWPWV